VLEEVKEVEDAEEQEAAEVTMTMSMMVISE